MPPCHLAIILPVRIYWSRILPPCSVARCSTIISTSAYRFYSDSSSTSSRRRRSSARRAKRERQSPSQNIVEALKASQAKYTLPHIEVHNLGHKLDLSYRHPTKTRWKHRRRLPGLQTPIKTPRVDDSPRLQTILASYISQRISRKSAGTLDGSVGGDGLEEVPFVASEAEFRLLTSRGYDHKDVKTWASIICEEDVNVAARELLLHSRALTQLTNAVRKPLPVFVPLFFARRSNMNPEALRCLLIYTWQEVHRKKSHTLFEAGAAEHWESVYPVNNQYPLPNDSAMFILIVRLLRYARTTWSESLVTITSMFIECFGNLGQGQRPSASRNSAYINVTTLFNRMLELLAIPSTLSPFHAIAYHQRAQFDLLQTMARHAPPLLITRNAYRAIISVQLANKKTEQERDWDSLKARSWPPWKQEKTGLDAGKGHVYGTSRALEVLRRSREAGYGAASWQRNGAVWDKAATILSGWDIDGSPTIQTRAMLIHKFLSHKDAVETSRSGRMSTDWNTVADHKTVWAARIRSTRTVHEAWACFLAYSDRGLPPEREIYFAMLEKLAYEYMRSRSDGDVSDLQDASGLSTHDINAGDGKELSSPPSSPKESTYVRIQPPSFHDLANEMHANNITPSDHWMGFLLRHAQTLGQGMRYLAWAAERTPSLESLLAAQPENDARLSGVPSTLFGCFLGLLCRFPRGDWLSTESLNSGQPYSPIPSGSRILHGYSPLGYACRILKARRPFYRPPWHQVLDALSRPVYGQAGISEDESDELHSAQALRRWKILQNLVNEMTGIGLKMDSETLRLICRGLEVAILSAFKITALSNCPPNAEPKSEDVIVGSDPLACKSALDADIINQANNILSTSSQYARTVFHEVMGTGKHLGGISHLQISATKSLPRLQTAPRGPLLHQYVRVLGLSRDWQGILDLVRWMVKYEREIADGIDMPRNGPRLLRRSIVATRVFLEAQWVNYDDSETRISEELAKTLEATYSAPRRTVEAVRRFVDGVEAWGGWPSDTEVEDYCTASNRRFPSVRTLLQTA